MNRIIIGRIEYIQINLMCLITYIKLFLETNTVKITIKEASYNNIKSQYNKYNIM